ncbi:MAG: ABC transporter ATP-binding protein/permease [Propionibacteriaceae bacterium]|jgi:ATP-binding cassette subfamily C protein|nr:ABC transporter ATP-binding protein/permease [Propionibacteriaceae bacterium]
MTRRPLRLAAELITLTSTMTPRLLAAIVLGCLGHLTAIAIPVLGAITICQALAHEPITAGSIGIIVCGLARAGLAYGEQHCNHFVAFTVLATLRDAVFRALRRLAPAKLEGRDKGNLISIITNDIELIEVFYAHTISPVAIAVTVSAIMTALLGSIHPWLGLIGASGYLIVGLVTPVVTCAKSRALGTRHRREYGELNGFVLDNLRGLRDILQFGAADERADQMRRRDADLATGARRMALIEGVSQAWSIVPVLGFTGAILATSLSLVDHNIISSAAAVVASVAMISSFGPVLALAALSNNLAHTCAAADRVLDILHEQPVTAEVVGGFDLAQSGAALAAVSFGYDENEVLTDCSIDLPSNRIIGITGPSGCGKSTLLRLLMRFWDANRGVVTIGGHDVRQIDTNSLRASEALVTQDTHLFCGTIADNLRVAKLDADLDELIKACQKASVHDFIMSTPQGYDTPVGELGDTLSAGERQRIGVARAFLHHGSLMMLDEPTSNLDCLNEAIILRSIAQETAGKTVVLVSHRSSTMAIADTVHRLFVPSTIDSGASPLDAEPLPSA